MKPEAFTNRDIFQTDFARGERIEFLRLLQSPNFFVRFFARDLIYARRHFLGLRRAR
jgi:hypothetical protein